MCGMCFVDCIFIYSVFCFIFLYILRLEGQARTLLFTGIMCSKRVEKDVFIFSYCWCKKQNYKNKTNVQLYNGEYNVYVIRSFYMSRELALFYICNTV